MLWQFSLSTNEFSIIGVAKKATSDSIERKKFPLMSGKFAIFISICLYLSIPLSLTQQIIFCIVKWCRILSWVKVESEEWLRNLIILLCFVMKKSKLLAGGGVNLLLYYLIEVLKSLGKFGGEVWIVRDLCSFKFPSALIFVSKCDKFPAPIPSKCFKFKLVFLCPSISSSCNPSSNPTKSTNNAFRQLLDIPPTKRPQIPIIPHRSLIENHTQKPRSDEFPFDIDFFLLRSENVAGRIREEATKERKILSL
jgi:hypothetical protein